MHRGYTKRWRKRWDKGYHYDSDLWLLMDYFIDFANYRDSSVYFPNAGLIPLKRGQHIFGTPQISAFMRWDRGKTRRKLKILKNIGFLTIKTTNKYSIATVINYDTYQPKENDSGHQNDQQTTSRRPADDQQTTTPNKVNKDKKVNKGKNITPPNPLKGGNGRKIKFPDNFVLTEHLKTYAIEKNICPDKVDELFQAFTDHHISKGTKLVDWNRGWYTWVRNAPEYSKWACNKKDGWDDLLKWAKDEDDKDAKARKV